MIRQLIAADTCYHQTCLTFLYMSLLFYACVSFHVKPASNCTQYETAQMRIGRGIITFASKQISPERLN